MSVWKSTTYKLDIAQEIYERFPSSVTKILKEPIGIYLSPADKLSSLNAESTWDDVAIECGWSDLKADHDIDRKVLRKYSDVEAWFLGSSALFHIISAVNKGLFEVKSAYNYNQVNEWVDEIGRLVAPSTQVAPKIVIREWGKRLERFELLGRKFESAAEGFKAMRMAFSRDRPTMLKIDQEKFFGTGDRIYYGRTIGNLCIMRGAAQYTNQGLIFTRNHLNLLVEALMRIANIYYYLATEYHDFENDAEAVHDMVQMTIFDGARARGKNADKVVQAYQKGRMYAQMLIFENQHVGALEEALKEFKKKSLRDVFDLGKFLEIVNRAQRSRRLDVLQVYKWMIPPDFDSTYAFADLYSWHSAPRPSGADDNAPAKMKEDWKRVVDERQRNIIVAYHAKSHEWPTFNESVACQPNNIEQWDLMKLFPYRTYGKDIVAQVKDKSTVSASFNMEVDGRSRREERSFLLWYLAHGNEVDTTEDAKILLQGSTPEDNYVKVAYKGEAHKPGSRLFFMAPPRHRILLGELEGNISDVATFYPGSLQGKDSHQKAEMLQKLFDVYEAPPGVGTEVDYEIYVITFDLAKFSPKSNPNVTRDYHDFWAVVFGYPAIKQMYKLGPESKILHMQSGLVMHYQNPGADLEGFRGRLMTLFHADMLGAACRKAREEAVIVGKAVLAVFIDDGAVKVAVAGRGEAATTNANRFLEIMQEIYAAAGQENHPNKTIVSKVGGELLAEQYLHGAKLKVPIKAAMRLYPDYENPAAAITEEFDSLFAASQGCVKDQGLWLPTYYRYVTAFVKSIVRWSKGSAQHATCLGLAMKIVTPKAYGGFGLQPLQGLTATVTLNLTAEGLGMLNRIGRSYPELRRTVARIVCQRILVRDYLMILRDPTRVRIEGTVLTENRLMMAIIYKLEDPSNPASKFMRGYRSEALRIHAAEVARAILDKEAANLPALERAWHATPLAYVESVVGKFRRAATIIAMLGYTAISNIRQKNSDEVVAIINAAHY